MEKQRHFDNTVVIVVIFIVVEGAGDGSDVVVLMMMRGGNRDGSRKPEVAAKAGVVGLVLMVMRGRGGRTRAGARGIREKRRGGEGRGSACRRGEIR